MVNVRVRQQERMNAAWAKIKAPVPVVELLAAPLKQTAIQQKAFASSLHAVLGSGHAPRCAEKLYFHHTSPDFAEL